MLSPSWVDYILSDAQRQAQVMDGKPTGTNWLPITTVSTTATGDGYTDQTFEFAVEQRHLQGKLSPEQYYGTMNDLMDVLQRVLTRG